MVALVQVRAAIQIGQRLIERQNADILQQRGEEYLLRHGLAQGIGERARGGCGDQRAAPVERVIDAVHLAGAQRLYQREAQGEGQGRIQAEHHQRLAQILALAPLRVERRIGDAQHLGGKRRIQAQHLRDFAHLDLGIAGELDDVARHAGRRGKAHQRAKMGLNLRIQRELPRRRTADRLHRVSVRRPGNLRGRSKGMH